MDSNEYIPRTENAQPQKKSGWGCMWIGCATVAGLLLFLMIGGGIGGYFFLKGQIAQYTSETPEKLPEVDYSEEERKAIQDRFLSFKTSLDEGKAVEPLVMSADELNAMISDNKDLKGRAFVRLDDEGVL